MVFSVKIRIFIKILRKKWNGRIFFRCARALFLFCVDCTHSVHICVLIDRWWVVVCVYTCITICSYIYTWHKDNQTNNQLTIWLKINYFFHFKHRISPKESNKISYKWKINYELQIKKKRKKKQKPHDITNALNLLRFVISLRMFSSFVPLQSDFRPLWCPAELHGLFS